MNELDIAPKYNSDQSAFYNDIKLNLILTILGIIAFVCTSYLEKISNRGVFLNILCTLFGLTFLVGFVQFWSLVFTCKYYFGYTLDRAAYYEELKNKIAISDTYEDYCKIDVN